jgi:hypothetical protein
LIGADVRPVHPVPEIKSGPMQGALLNLLGGSSAYLLAQDTLCGEFDQERVYGIAWQSNEFSGEFVDFLLGRGGRHPR